METPFLFPFLFPFFLSLLFFSPFVTFLFTDSWVLQSRKISKSHNTKWTYCTRTFYWNIHSTSLASFKKELFSIHVAWTKIPTLLLLNSSPKVQFFCSFQRTGKKVVGSREERGGRGKKGKGSWNRMRRSEKRVEKRGGEGETLHFNSQFFFSLPSFFCSKTLPRFSSN